MKLSTRTRYGIRAILELAENYGKRPLQLKITARNQGLSVKYLEHLMAMLKSAEIVQSARGSRGGYVLAKRLNQIKVSDCFNCLEEPVIISECIENDSCCEKTIDCVSRELWSKVQNAIMAVLQSKNLQNLIDRKKNVTSHSSETMQTKLYFEINRAAIPTRMGSEQARRRRNCCG